MKKLIALLTAIAVFSASFATSVIEIKPVLRADQIFIPTDKTGGKISLMELSRIKIKDFEILRGQKMKFTDRLGFKVIQKKLRDNIAPDGTLDTKKIEKAFKKQQRGGETGFHFGGFALGFFLGLIGVLIAYLIKDDYKSNRTKWAWLGLGVIVVLSLAFYI